jgi:hypothetical protein
LISQLRILRSYLLSHDAKSVPAREAQTLRSVRIKIHSSIERGRKPDAIRAIAPKTNRISPRQTGIEKARTGLWIERVDCTLEIVFSISSDRAANRDRIHSVSASFFQRTQALWLAKSSCESSLGARKPHIDRLRILNQARDPHFSYALGFVPFRQLRPDLFERSRCRAHPTIDIGDTSVYRFRSCSELRHLARENRTDVFHQVVLPLELLESIFAMDGQSHVRGAACHLHSIHRDVTECEFGCDRKRFGQILLADCLSRSLFYAPTDV